MEERLSWLSPLLVVKLPVVGLMGETLSVVIGNVTGEYLNSL